MSFLQFGANADADVSAGTAPDEDQPSGKAWLDLFAKLSMGVNSVAAELADARKREQDRLRHVAVTTTLDGASINVTGTDIQDFGGPQPGREWVVRLLSAYSPAGANAATATWYIGQKILTAPGQLSPQLAIWQFASLPGFQNFTSDVHHLKPGERLLVGITGAPAASNIYYNVSIDDQYLYDTDPRGR